MKGHRDPLIATLSGHSDVVNSLALSPDETIAVSASSDRTLVVWDLTTFRHKVTLTGHGSDVNTVVLTSDGARAISGGGRRRTNQNAQLLRANEVGCAEIEDNAIRVWDLANGKQIKSFDGSPSPILSLYVASTDRAVNSGHEDGTLMLWDLSKGCIGPMWKQGGPITMLAAARETHLFSISEADFVLWKFNSPGYAPGQFDGARQSLLALHPEKLLLVMRESQLELGTYLLAIWDLTHEDPETEKLERIGTFHRPFTAAAFTPDADECLLGDIDGTIYQVSIRNKTISHTYRGHTAEVTSIVCSRDGLRMLSTSRDGTVKIWELQIQRRLPVVLVSEFSAACTNCGFNNSVRQPGILDLNDDLMFAVQLTRENAPRYECSQCGMTNSLSPLPLLVVDFSSNKSPLFFALRSPGGSIENDAQEQLAFFRDRFGHTWEDTWIEGGIEVIDRMEMQHPLADRVRGVAINWCIKRFGELPESLTETLDYLVQCISPEEVYLLSICAPLLRSNRISATIAQLVNQAAPERSTKLKYAALRLEQIASALRDDYLLVVPQAEGPTIECKVQALIGVSKDQALHVLARYPDLLYDESDVVFQRYLAAARVTQNTTRVEDIEKAWAIVKKGREAQLLRRFEMPNDMPIDDSVQKHFGYLDEEAKRSASRIMLRGYKACLAAEVHGSDKAPVDGPGFLGADDLPPDLSEKFTRILSVHGLLELHFDMPLLRAFIELAGEFLQDQRLNNYPMLYIICANFLGNFLLSRHRELPSDEDLEQGLRVLEGAYSFCELVEDAKWRIPSKGMTQANLAIAYRVRYEEHGRRQDIDDALSSIRSAIAANAVGGPDWGTMHDTQGMILLRRFEALGDISDLDAALASHEIAACSGLGDTPTHLNMKASVLCRRYSVSNREQDITEGIKLFEKALASMYPGIIHWDRANIGLGLAYYSRYYVKRDSEDLTRAIRVFETALSACDEGSHPWRTIIGNLSAALVSRFDNEKRANDLNLAITLAREAIAQLGLGSDEWCRNQYMLATALIKRWRSYGEAMDRHDAISVLRFLLASVTDEQRPDAVMLAGKSLGELTFVSREWHEAAASYQRAMSATQILHSTQLAEAERELRLEHSDNVFRRGAYALAKIGKLKDAVVALERGRARNLNLSLRRDQADLQRIEELDKLAFDQFVVAASHLRSLEASDYSVGIRASPPSSESSALEQRRMAREALNAAIARIRSLEGFQKFLAETEWDDLEREVKFGSAVTYMLTTEVGSILLVLYNQNGEVEVSGLWSSLTEQQLDTLLIGEGNQDGFLWSQLWAPEMLESSLRPVMDVLGANLAQPLVHLLDKKPLRSLILIPCGILALLPIHAAVAVLLDQSSTPELDITYTPSLQTLAAIRSASAKGRGDKLSLVAVGNPTAPQSLVEAIRSGLCEIQNQAHAQANALPLDRVDILCEASSNELLLRRDMWLAASRQLLAISAELQGQLGQLLLKLPADLPYAEFEVGCVAKHFSASKRAVFRGDEALHEDVMQALGSTIAHLACHGSFDPETPLASWLQISTGSPLSLREVLGSNASKVREISVVILSACQSGLSDFQRLPDEAIGLPSGFLRGGVPSVIASLWPVSDLATAIFMDCLYREWLHEGMVGTKRSLAGALRAAQAYLRTTSAAAFAQHFDVQRKTCKSDPSAYAVNSKIWRYFNGMPKNYVPFGETQFWGAFACYGISSPLVGVSAHEHSRDGKSVDLAGAT